MNNTSTYFLFDLTQISISKKFEKEIVFESSILAWIRIHNPDKYALNFKKMTDLSLLRR
jgi:hypothetical protein